MVILGKDKLDNLQKHNVIYKISYNKCPATCIGTSKRIFKNGETNSNDQILTRMNVLCGKILAFTSPNAHTLRGFFYLTITMHILTFRIF